MTTGALVVDENTGISLATEPRSAIRIHPSSMTLPLLLEVGCEEIPARFLRDAERGLGERVRAALEESRLLAKSAVRAAPNPSPEARGPQGDLFLQTYSTPRRLVVHVPSVLAQQPDKVEEVMGPPVKVAIDGEGKYTRAAESFAQKNSATLEDLIRTTTPKGEYLSLRKTTQGRSALEVLPAPSSAWLSPRACIGPLNPIPVLYGPSVGSSRSWEKGSTPPRLGSKCWACSPAV